MVMTKADILAEYNQSKDRRKQITILADQNLMSEQAIVDILTAGGCDVPSYKYRKTVAGSRAPKKASTKKTKAEPKPLETATETIPRSMATRMIVETAALDTVREFLKDTGKTWDEFCLFVSGVVDLTAAVGKRCG